MGPFPSLIGSAVLAIAAFAVPHRVEAQPHWQVAAAEICQTRHSYRFYQRFSTKFELDVAGPNDAIETNEAVFRPETGKAESRSVWKLAVGADAQPWQELKMIATCEADPWLFSKELAKCDGFQGKASCTKPNCTAPSASPPFRVPAGVLKDRPLQAGAIPKPTILIPSPDQAYMVLEAPLQLEAGLPSAPYCGAIDVTATGPGGASIGASLPAATGASKGALSFVGKPQGKWTMTAAVRQYTGKPAPAAWSSGAGETRGFYVGPSWPGAKEKPVSATMLKVVSPAKGTSVPVKGGALTISIHQDLRSAANPKRATLFWQYVESPMPGTPWPGTRALCPPWSS